MRQLSPRILLGFFCVLPAVYSFMLLGVSLFIQNDMIMNYTPLKSLVLSIIFLLMLPSVAFFVNSDHKQYTRVKGQRLLGILISLVWLCNVILFISACTYY